jgi:Putative DNA-binding domain
MIFGNRPLRDITEIDIRALLESGMAEHVQLEYKSELYPTNDQGRREFLKDICMFANATGGVLLLGVSELRGEDGNPSGVPDPNGELGIESANPENQLASYDAQIVACIQDRLAVEAHPVRIQNGRFVMIFRVPNSLLKPHCVRRDGHVYFISRRDRQKYEMDLREIKEQTMRTASQLERAQQLLDHELHRQICVGMPALFVAQLPVFYRDFLVDITQDAVVREMQTFDVTRRNLPEFRQPTYEFEGLKRSSLGRDVTLHRNGMLTLLAEIQGERLQNAPNHFEFELAILDLLVHEFAELSRDGSISTWD